VGALTSELLLAVEWRGAAASWRCDKDQSIMQANASTNAKEASQRMRRPSTSFCASLSLK